MSGGQIRTAACQERGYSMSTQSLNLQHDPRIDHLRCLAAGVVFLFHFYLHFYTPDVAALTARPWLGIITEGHTGVALFFTLSGFLFMQIALHNGHITYSSFIRNRVLRIFPLFTVVFVLALSIGRDNFVPQDAFYFFFTNLGHAPTSNHFITGAAWTISVECAFYLVFPFLARFAMQIGPRYLVQWLVLMLLFKLGAYNVMERSTHMLFSTLVGRFDQFLIGMLAAMLLQRYRSHGLLSSRWLAPAALLLVVANSALQSRYGSFFLAAPKQAFWITWSMQESLVWAIFIVAWVTAPLRLPDWLDRALQQGGRISFSFYLLHAIVIYLVHLWIGLPRPTGVGWLDAAIIVVPVYGLTWAIALLSYTTIEKPFLDLRRRYGAPLDAHGETDRSGSTEPRHAVLAPAMHQPLALNEKTQ